MDWEGAKTIIGGRWQTAGTAAKGYGAMGWVRPDRQGKTRQAMAMSRVREDRVLDGETGDRAK